MKEPKEHSKLTPLLTHDDGSMVSMEEAEEALKDIPFNEGKQRLQEIRLDCTIEEYMRQNNCVFADEFDNIMINYETFKKNIQGI